MEEFAALLSPGDTIVDGGNSNFKDSKRRHALLKARGIHFVDAGISGGVWGLVNGYGTMVGGDVEAVKPLEPIFQSLAPADGGYIHCGPPGSGHYTKMVHNGIEYGLMQAYAEGFEILHASEYPLDLEAISKAWMHGTVIRSWLLELAGRAFEQHGTDLVRHQGLGRRLRRGPLDGPGRHRPQRSGADHRDVAPDALPQPAGRQLHGEGARRAAQPVRRARGQERVELATSTPRKTQTSRPAKRGATTAPGTTKGEAHPLQEQVHVYRQAQQEGTDLNPLRQGLRLEKVPPPCVIVIFGATGDLTHRKILPALYNLRRAGLLPPETSRRRLRPPSAIATRISGARCKRPSRSTPACRSSRPCGTTSQSRSALPAGRLRRSRVYRRAGRTPGADRRRARHARQPAVLPGHAALDLRGDRRPTSATPGWTAGGRARLGAHRHREAVRPRPRVGAPPERRAACASSTSRRSTASTTTWAKRPCATCWSSASATASSSRSGTGATSTMCRSRWPRTVGVEGRGAFYEEAGATRDILQNHVLQLLTPGGDGAAHRVRGRRAARREGARPARHRPATGRRPASAPPWCAASTPLAGLATTTCRATAKRTRSPPTRTSKRSSR